MPSSEAASLIQASGIRKRHSYSFKGRIEYASNPIVRFHIFVKSAYLFPPVKGSNSTLYTYQKTIVHGYMEVYNELFKINNLQQIYELKNRETEVLTESIDISSALFRTGRANYLEVLITQQNALQSRLELIDARKNQFQSTVNIYKALGGGWR